MKKYEVLSSLPSYGPMYISVAEHSEPYYAEGYAVRFYKKDGTAWVANFKPGGRDLNIICELSDTDHLLVIAGGTAYIMNPEQTKPVSVFGIGYTAVLKVHDGRLVLLDSYGITVIETSGDYWISDQMALDGMKDVLLNGNLVTGLSGDIQSNGAEVWVPFVYNIDTKELSGTNYRFADQKKRAWWKW